MALRGTQDLLIFETDAVSATTHLRVSQDLLIFEVDVPPPVSVTYPINPPAIAGIGPQSLKFRAIDIVGETVSPFTASQQEQHWPGQWWEIEASLPPMPRSQAAQWIAWLVSLNGKFGTALIGPYDAQTAQGVATGTPLVNGANASGSGLLTTKGWTHSIAGILKAGDYIQLAAAASPTRLHMVEQDANSDGSGNATLSIWPNIREALADGTAIVVASAVGTFRLMENQREWDIDKARIYGINFKMKEAL